jgi:hypothetical protein
MLELKLLLLQLQLLLDRVAQKVQVYLLYFYIEHPVYGSSEKSIFLSVGASSSYRRKSARKFHTAAKLVDRHRHTQKPH